MESDFRKGALGPEYPLERLIVRAVSTENMRIDLADTVFIRPFEEVALVVYIELNDTGENYMTTVFQRKFAGMLKISEKEIFRKAFANTCARQLPRIYGDFPADFDGKEGEFMTGRSGFWLEEGPGGSTLTTSRRLNGAVAIFMPGVAKRIGEILRDDFYFTFPSIHFSKIHKRKGAFLPAILNAAGQMRNAPYPEEYLSDQVYYYSRKLDRFGVVRCVESGMPG